MRIARLAKILLKSIAIGVGALVLGSSIASASTEPTPSASKNTVVVSSEGSSEVISISESITTSTTTHNEEVFVPGSPVENIATNQTDQKSNLSVAAITKASPATNTVVIDEGLSIPVEATTSDDVIVTSQTQVETTIGNSTRVVPALTQRSQLASSMFQLMSRPFSVANQSLISNTEEIILNSPQTNPPAPVQEPIVPIGMVSAILSLFSQAIPGYFVNSFVQNPDSSALALIALTMVALAVALTARTTVVSYGTWLKMTGFTHVARSGLPNFFSSLATPRLMGYACAPAPFS